MLRDGRRAFFLTGFVPTSLRSGLARLWLAGNSAAAQAGVSDKNRGLRMKVKLIASVLIGFVTMPLAASAQTIQTRQPPVAEPAPSTAPDVVEHVDGKHPVGPRPIQPASMRFRPGGMLLKSFDANQDGLVSREELLAGAKAAFAQADANSDGVVSGLEQTAWAARFGGVNDVLSNAMIFDSNLDHSVSQDEFVVGVMRLAEPVKDATGGLQVAKLMVEEHPEGLPPTEQGRQRVQERRGG